MTDFDNKFIVAVNSVDKLTEVYQEAKALLRLPFMKSEKLGLILVLLGMSLFSIQDVFIKLIADRVSLMQILFFRASLGTLLLICFLWVSGNPIKFGSFYPKTAIFRGVTFFIGFTLFYVSISKISLAEANSLFFSNPIFVTIFSVFFLKISIGIHRFFAVCVGFLGSFS